MEKLAQTCTRNPITSIGRTLSIEFGEWRSITHRQTLYVVLKGPYSVIRPADSTGTGCRVLCVFAALFV